MLAHSKSLINAACPYADCASVSHLSMGTEAVTTGWGWKLLPRTLREEGREWLFPRAPPLPFRNSAHCLRSSCLD